ncbi:ATP-binding protein [Pseudanabaena sp. FACHB-2040]|uniref:ATP-binding protein n=1 Tax=Pseudanabaena sp. FACHB-2040 TaxID=2692859 RepID=UPI0016890FA1|nr:ATP-binding protein [Cyanobacteria bacterium Co-bin8]MBD2260377.1 ATP-binding protein [Pseudanabaena sp. FACHB-2040]
MVVISPPPANHKWGTLSFVSTLYLRPVLDLLLVEVPTTWQAEVRLGLQEALVNAAKHGNNLDPAKKVSVQFSVFGDYHWWIIADQGSGFKHPYQCEETLHGCTYHAGECGRGLYILYQVFDEVQWARNGQELHLCKKVRRRSRLPLIS